MNIDEFFEVFTGGNSNVATWTPKAIKEFAEDYHNQQLRLHGVMFSETDKISSDSILDEPEPLWKSHDLEVASSEAELPCRCGKPMEEPYAPCCSLACWCEMFEAQGN